MKLDRYLKMIRLNNNEKLKDMAEKLNVSSAFLSAVENGRKKFPEKWFDEFKTLYNLSPLEIEKLKDSTKETNGSVLIRLDATNNLKTHLALKFARSFEELDDTTCIDIEKLLDKKGRNKK